MIELKNYESGSCRFISINKQQILNKEYDLNDSSSIGIYPVMSMIFSEEHGTLCIIGSGDVFKTGLFMYESKIDKDGYFYILRFDIGNGSFSRFFSKADQDFEDFLDDVHKLLKENPDINF